MRRLGFAIAVFVGALAAPARAGSADEPIDPDEQVEPRLPTVQLVQAWPKTKQALLYDPIQGTYVVVAAGQNVDGFRVSRIVKNQIVLSTVGGPARDYVLLPTPVADLPDVPSTSAPPSPTPSPTPTPPPSPAPPALLDPYPAGVLDPYGNEGVRIVEAPPQSKAVPGAAAPSPSPSPSTGPSPSPSPSPVPKPVPRPSPVPSPKPVAKTPPPVTAKPAPAITKPAPAPAGNATPGVVVLDKKDLNAALADFGTLTKDSRLTLGPSGVAFAHVAPASLFAKVGLRDGDRVVSINGAPIRSLDDAADLYAQLGGMKQLSLDVVRGAGHVTLHADLR